MPLEGEEDSEEKDEDVFYPEKEKEEDEKDSSSVGSEDGDVKSDYEEGYDYTYSYYDTTSTDAPIEKHPIIIAIPGEDVQAPAEAEVILPCPTQALAEDVSYSGQK